jgi:hypothetical protein
MKGIFTQRKDITGQRFGRLVAINYAYSKNGRAYWHCKCDCGNEIITMAQNLYRGFTHSCGCLAKELHQKEMSEMSYRHGLGHTRLCRLYHGMIYRCYNKNAKTYNNYGGRGIKICDEWLNNFVSFYNWAITHGYHDALSIDRIDVNGNYCPENCRWANKITQARNKRNNVHLIINGEDKTMAEWAELSGIGIKTMWMRYKYGKTGYDLIAPLRKYHTRCPNENLQKKAI